ncbi:MAG: ABC transporter permease [Chloroflexota bacterium]
MLASLGRIGAIVRKEFLQIRRDRRALGIILMLPAMQLLLLGYAINTVVDHLATIVFDESQTPESRSLLAALENTTYFDVTRAARSQAEALRAIDDGSAKVAVMIPPDFGQKALRGEQALAQMVVDGSDPNVAQTALFAGGVVAEVQSVQLLGGLVQRMGRALPAGGIELRPVVLYNPSMLSVQFMIPGLVGMILQFQTLLLTSLAIVREREDGTLEQLIVTPIRPIELMLGKVIPYVCTALAASALALALGRFLFGVAVVGSLPLLFGLSLLFLTGSLGMGLLVSTISSTQRQAMQVALFIMLPSIMLSGFIFSRDGMPWIIRQLSLLIPLTFFLQILRGVILKGVGIDVLWSQTLSLAVFGVAVFSLSASRFRKRLG